jgi:predicted metalloprotease with PDZ domain
MSNENFNKVREAIAVARDANDYVELLVVEEKYYKVLKSEKIPIDSTSATVISAPAMMPADFVHFPKLIPRICNLRLGRNDTIFGFKVVNGENDIGVYIQTISPDSPARDAGLRKSDRIIEINDRNVDRQSSEYIMKKLDKARRKGMVKLFVADTKTYEHYVKNNIKFNSNDLNKAICSTTPQTIQSSQIDKKCE